MRRDGPTNGCEGSARRCKIVCGSAGAALYRGLFQRLPQELEAVHGDFVARGFDAAPDGGGAGDDLDVGGEGFDDDDALITDGLERGGDGFPINVIVTGRAAAAAAGVEMAQRLARLANGGGGVLFLDVHVEGVEVQPERGIADVADHFEALVAGVDEIGLETVEWLKADLAAMLLRVFGEGLEMADDGAPLLLVFIGRDGVGAAHSGIDGADQGGAIERDHLVNEAAHVIEAGLLGLGRAAQIAVRPHAGAHGTADEAVLVQLAFDVGGVNVGGVFDGDFDGVEAPFFELFEELRALVGKGRGEEECVDAESHNDCGKFKV